MGRRDALSRQRKKYNPTDQKWNFFDFPRQTTPQNVALRYLVNVVEAGLFWVFFSIYPSSLLQESGTKIVRLAQFFKLNVVKMHVSSAVLKSRLRDSANEFWLS